MTGEIAASVVIVAYNSAEHLPTVLAAIAADPSRPAEVIVVDNGSDDRSADVAAAAGAEVVRLQSNRGFGGGCHAGVDAAGTDTIVFLNPDATPRLGWLRPLIAALDGDEVGAATATIELADRPGHFNTSGGELTYVGVAYASGVGDPIGDERDPVEVPFPSGAAMAVRRATWDRLGGFRPELFLYHEDTDLGWRLRMLGLRTVRVPGSLVGHHYEFARNPEKLFMLERNRWALLACNYRRSTLALLLPVLIVVELGVLVTAIRDGWGRRKLGSWPAAWRLIRESAAWHRRLQTERTVGDAAIIESMGTSLAGVRQVEPPAGAGVVDGLLRLYRRLIVPLVRAGDRRRGLA